MPHPGQKPVEPTPVCTDTDADRLSTTSATTTTPSPEPPFNPLPTAPRSQLPTVHAPTHNDEAMDHEPQMHYILRNGLTILQQAAAAPGDAVEGRHEKRQAAADTLLTALISGMLGIEEDEARRKQGRAERAARRTSSAVEGGSHDGAGGTSGNRGSFEEEGDGEETKAWKAAMNDGKERLTWDKTVNRKKTGVGKGNGWSRLPPNLIRYIFTLTIPSIEVPVVLRDRWDASGYGHSKLVQMHLAKRWLASTRTICTSWKRAVDIHPFWLEYISVMDPTVRVTNEEYKFYSAHSIPYKNGRSRASSSGSYPSDGLYNRPQGSKWRASFEKALSTSSRSCLVCRINTPTRDPLPANPKILRVCDHFGWLAPCQLHVGSFCQNCLQEEHNIKFDAQYQIWRKEPNGDPVNLRVVDHCDTNELGERRNGKLVCVECRYAALILEGQRVIRECARGGPELGVFRASILDETISGGWYAHAGKSTARLQAEQAVEELWLIDHSNWHEMEDDAMTLQQLEKRLKERMMKAWEEDDDFNEPEHYAQQRRQIFKKMTGETSADNRGSVWEDREDMARLRTEWKSEFFLRTQMEIWDNDDEEEESQVGERWWGKLRDAAINSYIRDRVDFGYWVTPAEEVTQLANPPTAPRLHTSLAQLARRVIHPFADEPDKPDVYDDLAGCMRAGRKQGPGPAHESFLPPEELLSEIEIAYANRLQATLWAPFREIMLAMKDIAGRDPDIAEVMCAKVKLDELLAFLRGKYVWVRGGLVMARRKRLGLDPPSPSDGGSDASLGEPLTRAVNNDTNATNGDGIDENDRGSIGSLEYHGQEEEYDTGSDTAETVPHHGLRIEYAEEEPTKAGLNLYGIEEVAPSSPQSVTISEAAGRELDETMTMQSEGDVENGNEAVGVVVKASMTSLGKRKEAPEGAQTVKASKERKSESPESNTTSAHDDPGIWHRRRPSSQFAHHDTDATSERDEHQPASPTLPETARSLATALSVFRGETATSLGSTFLSAESSREASGEGDEPDSRAPRHESAITPCAPGTIPSRNDIETSDIRPEATYSPASGIFDETVTPTVPEEDQPLETPAHSFQLIRSIEEIPWIPNVPIDDLGEGTKQLIEKIWWDVREELRVCFCSVCERGRVRRRT